MAIKSVAICKIDSNGAPDVGTGFDRWARVEGNLPGNYGIFIIVGTGAQLTAIQANSNCIGGLVVTSSGQVRWPELDVAIPSGLRTKINNYRTAQGLSTIPAG